MKRSSTIFLLQFACLLDTGVPGMALQCYFCGSTGTDGDRHLDCMSEDAVVLAKYKITCLATYKQPMCTSTIHDDADDSGIYRGCDEASFARLFNVAKIPDPPVWLSRQMGDKYAYIFPCTTDLCNSPLLLDPEALNRLRFYKATLEKWQKMPKSGQDIAAPLSPPNSNADSNGKNDNTGGDNASNAKDAAAAIADKVAEAKAASDRAASAGKTGDLAGSKAAADEAAKAAKDAADKLSSLIDMQATSGGLLF